MKKLIVLAGVLSLVAAACSGSDEVVSTVNGEDITRSSVQSLVRESGDGFSKQDFATYLSVVIQWEAADQAATDEFGVEVTEEQIDERVDDLIAASEHAGTLEQYLESVNATESGLRRFAESLLVQEAIEADLSSGFAPVTDDAVAQELAEFPADWTQVCVSHILVASEDEANDIKTQLDDGGDFGAIATRVSIDPGSAENGGDLGCAAPSGFVEPFAEATLSAEIGTVTDPVETEFGYHVILVSDRIDAPDDVVREYLQGSRSQEALDAWFATMIEAADITVVESVGVWVTEPTPQVLASN